MNNTAVIQINPENNTAVIKLHDQVARVLEHAKTLSIASEADVKVATADLNIIANLKRAIEEKRTSYTQPINTHLSDVNRVFKTISDPLKDADKIYRGKILTYRAEAKQKKEKAEAINRLRTEAAGKEMELKGELTEPVKTVDVPPPLPDRVHTDVGSLGKTMVKRWRVVDIHEVPDEYKIIDAAKVGKVVRAGIPSIQGIEIWEEESLRVTPRKIE